MAAAAPELRVIIYDRRNLGRSQVTFGSEPQMVEEGEDLHVLIERLDVAPVALYGMSSGGRSNMILGLSLSRRRGGLGHRAAYRRAARGHAFDPRSTFLKYLHDEQLTTL